MGKRGFGNGPEMSRARRFCASLDIEDCSHKIASGERRFVASGFDGRGGVRLRSVPPHFAWQLFRLTFRFTFFRSASPEPYLRLLLLHESVPLTSSAITKSPLTAGQGQTAF